MDDRAWQFTHRVQLAPNSYATYFMASTTHSKRSSTTRSS
jgi:hypothetical protein